MTYKEVEIELKNGKVGILPKYEGYFYWDFYLQKPYMKNKDYKTYNLDDLKGRTDWFYII